MTTTVTGRNQITIPAALVERMGLKPGMRIEWLPGEETDEFVCRVLPDPARLAASLRGAGRKFLKAGAIHPIDALVTEREEDDRQREAGFHEPLEMRFHHVITAFISLIIISSTNSRLWPNEVQLGFHAF